MNAKPKVVWRASRCLSLLMLPIHLVLCGCQQNGKAESGAIDRKGPAAEASKKDPQVRGLARLEPASGLIVVGARPGAAVKELRAAVGASVKKGDVLAVLEGNLQAEKQLALARLAKKGADFQRELKNQQLQLERQRFDRLRDVRLSSLREHIRILKTKLEVAQQNREKVTGVDPTADRIAVQDYIINQTKGELLQTQLELTEFETDLELLTDKRRLEDRELSEENPDRQVLDEKIHLAEAALEQTLVRAPSDGVVLEVVVHEGEVSSGPVLYLADTSQMSAVVELFQTDVAAVQPGDKGYVEMFDKRIPGVVSHVGTLVGENRLTSVDPMALADRRVVKVTLKLLQSEYAARYVNMQVSAVILPGSAAQTSKDSGATP